MFACIFFILTLSAVKRRALKLFYELSYMKNNIGYGYFHIKQGKHKKI